MHSQCTDEHVNTSTAVVHAAPSMEHSLEDDGGPMLHHMIAGAVAGTTEHCGMFPVDTIKTHIQAYRPALATTASGVPLARAEDISMTEAMHRIIKRRGFVGLFRGLSAMVSGAGYELCKNWFGGNRPGHHPIASATAGAIATIMSDAVLTPMDAVKQKMQLGRLEYRGVLHCIKHTHVTCGIWKGFYAGYFTTLVMNVPYSGVYFASYELFKKLIAGDNEETPLTYCVAGGGAGVCSAAFTNPLDVARTRLQTQIDSGRSYAGMVDALKSIWVEEGVRGFAAGIKARMIFHSMAASICWVTYESVKKFLKGDASQKE